MQDILADIRSKLSGGVYRNEEHVRLSLVSRIIGALGWNVWDPSEVDAEFCPVPSEDKTKVDIALFLTPQVPSAFIEIKAVGRIEGNLPAIELQMRDYNRNNTALFSIITDGREWRFYFSQTGGEFSKKCFKVLDFIEDSLEDLERELKVFLSKDEIQSGDAENNAKKYLALNRRQRVLEDALPKARKLIFEPPYPSLPQALQQVASKNGISISAEQASKFIKDSEKKKYPVEPPKRQPLQPSARAKQGAFEFQFTVGKAFLNNGYLTIPREFNAYFTGLLNLKDKRSIVLSSINGRRIEAYLYHARSGWGPYYQIRIVDKAHFRTTGGLTSVRIDDVIKVSFHGIVDNQPVFSFSDIS